MRGVMLLGCLLLLSGCASLDKAKTGYEQAQAERARIEACSDACLAKSEGSTQKLVDCLLTECSGK